MLEELHSAVSSRFPSMWVMVESESVFLRGAFPLRDAETHEEFDRFQVELELPRDFPKSLPIVREVGGRIPWTAERHCSGGAACLFVPEERYQRWPAGAGIVEFLEGPVNHFLFGQAYFEAHGRWPFGERSHGVLGRFEYYQELAGSGDPKVVVEFIKLLAAKNPKGHWDCYCGSGQRLRNCHFRLLLAARDRIPSTVAEDALVSLAGELRRLRKQQNAENKSEPMVQR